MPSAWPGRTPCRRRPLSYPLCGLSQSTVPLLDFPCSPSERSIRVLDGVEPADTPLAAGRHGVEQTVPRARDEGTR